MKLRIIAIILITFFLNSHANSKTRAPWVGTTFKGRVCEGEHMDYGPYNYANAEHRKHKLPIVEAHHFTANVERLVKGKSASLIGDIAYTLRAFPNHYKALNSLIYYKFIFMAKPKHDKRRKTANGFPVECYFQRAINFVPKDAQVHMLYAVYLKKLKRYELADKHFQKAIKLKPDELKFHFIYGMFLLKQKKFDSAKQQAILVYDGKYPNPKLKKKLMAAGYWK